MVWQDTSILQKKLPDHALLSPSSYHWVHYDKQKMSKVYMNKLNKEHGVKLHKFAADAIELNMNVTRRNDTLNIYINDAINYKMKPEVFLYYSDYCYGTADAISFRNNLLRIHDLKTGFSPTKMTQLEIYAALFCLMYHIDPRNIGIELRIYQLDKIVDYIPSPETILERMEIIKQHSATLQEIENTLKLNTHDNKKKGVTNSVK